MTLYSVLHIEDVVRTPWQSRDGCNIQSVLYYFRLNPISIATNALKLYLFLYALHNPHHGATALHSIPFSLVLGAGISGPLFPNTLHI